MSILRKSKEIRKQKSKLKDKSSDSIPGFLFKTYQILEDASNQSIISWNDDGTAFAVKKINEFTEQILPKYFKHSNYSSFVRQLNMYDFHKIRQESLENEFKHKLFQRGQANLLSQIKRKTTETLDQIALLPNYQVQDHQDDNQLMMQEMMILKNKQEDLDQVCQILLGQNSKLLGENRQLWNQMMKNKQNHERKLEKIILWIVNHIIKGSTIENSATQDLLSEAQALKSPMARQTAQNRIDKLHASNKQNDKAKNLLKLIQLLKISDSQQSANLSRKKLKKMEVENQYFDQPKALTINGEIENQSQNQYFQDPNYIDLLNPNQLCITNEPNDAQLLSTDLAVPTLSKENLSEPFYDIDRNELDQGSECIYNYENQNWGNTDPKYLEDKSLDHLFD